MMTPHRITLAQLIALRRAAPPIPEGAQRSLSDRFIVPPFSVLDARQGYWQTRKRAWLALGIQSELGRGGNSDDMTNASDRAITLAGGFAPRHGRADRTTPGGRGINSAWRDSGGNGKPRLAKAYNIGLDADKDNDWATEDGHGSGTSIFDPVLCELAYRWFCPAAGLVLDPFAGGSVRGIVAARLGRGYVGVDLRPEQADANYEQVRLILGKADSLEWAVGDAADIADLLPGEYDFVFSCPPYADLERYSDDPRDLSTLAYDAFILKYRHIIGASCRMLRDDRFACFVVGDVRDRATGVYRDFVSDTIAAFRDAGLELYNEAILVTSVGSLPIRVGRQFAQYRKLGKTHQNVLVFVKGDPAAASAACGDVDVDDLPMPEPSRGGVAVCAADVAGLAAEGYVDGDGTEVPVIPMPTVEAALVADAYRGEARVRGTAVPRTWVCVDDAWRRVDDGVYLTYLVGDVVYLNRAVFPEAPLPAGTRPPIVSLDT